MDDSSMGRGFHAVICFNGFSTHLFKDGEGAMNVLLLLIPMALLLGSAALIGFFYATLTGQMDDLETPALRALIDDSERTNNAKK